jgi:nucleotide-binding universal stress UspA family protein
MVVLAAVDGETVPDPVVSQAYDLATTYSEEFVVVHVMPNDKYERQKAAAESDSTDSFPVEEAMAPGVSYIDELKSETEIYGVDRAAEDAETVARTVLEKTLGEYDAVSVEGRVGSPSDEILAMADRLDARYLVIGSRKRSPVGKAVFGSCAQSVLLNANRPVVSVRLDGD